MNRRFGVRMATVLSNGRTAGHLLANGRRFVFLYDKAYLASGAPSIAIGLPKSKRIFSSRFLFPYFSGLLPEGENRKFVCGRLGLDPDDGFGLLTALAGRETIGNVVVRRAR